MNLLLFLSNRCNMSCGYCFLDLNRGPAVVLDLEAAKRACSDHLRRHPRGGARFTFLGGEPTIHYPLLKAVAGHIRAESGGGAFVGVVTNGARLCPEKAGELEALGVRLTVSLDGTAAAHDRHRSLLGSRESALEKTLKSLEGVDKSRLQVNMVVCADTVGSLLSSVEFLRSRGLRRLSFHLNVLESWSESGLRALKAALEGFIRYARALDQAAPGGLEIVHLDSFSPERRREGPGHPYDDIVLGADGRYYPCDSFFALPYGQIGGWAVGDAFTGLDRVKREAHHRSALEFIHGHLERPHHYSCPREAYFHAVATGSDPARAVRDFDRADAILGDALSGLAAGSVGVHA